MTPVSQLPGCSTIPNTGPRSYRHVSPDTLELVRLASQYLVFASVLSISSVTSSHTSSGPGWFQDLRQTDTLTSQSAYHEAQSGSSPSGLLAR